MKGVNKIIMAKSKRLPEKKYSKIIKKSLFFNIKEKTKELLTPKDKEAFPYSKSQLYYGVQGSGKTLSMVKHLHILKKRYPKAIVVSNLYISNMEYIHFESFDELQHHLQNVTNGKYGVIFAIDEIHNYFHSHDSRSIPMWIVNVFSQQRKAHRVILGTSQEKGDVTKTIRDRMESIIECKKMAGIIWQSVLDPKTVNKVYGEERIKVVKLGFFVPTTSLYNSYDTYQIINSGRSVMGNIQPINQNIIKVNK